MIYENTVEMPSVDSISKSSKLIITNKKAKSLSTASRLSFYQTILSKKIYVGGYLIFNMV